jgi:hypothetical protein
VQTLYAGPTEVNATGSCAYQEVDNVSVGAPDMVVGWDYLPDVCGGPWRIRMETGRKGPEQPLRGEGGPWRGWGGRTARDRRQPGQVTELCSGQSMVQRIL